METYLTIVDVAVEGSVKKNVHAFKLPTWHTIPLPGDLVQIPEAAAKKENIPMMLKVKARHFILDHLILDRLSRDCKSCIILQTEPLG